MLATIAYRPLCVCQLRWTIL